MENKEHSQGDSSGIENGQYKGKFLQSLAALKKNLV